MKQTGATLSMEQAVLDIAQYGGTLTQDVVLQVLRNTVFGRCLDNGSLEK